ncbi:hypothetical protein PIB30_004110 [Stylosanthes scabra]|uniref:Uncharacterized protein n=1 Tax=Stylosanthes scabra TaxID=79078 RepID=A0ABU6Z0G1_9FABA|nr:hypothetical protein [Stylosanthes scabra]
MGTDSIRWVIQLGEKQVISKVNGMIQCKSEWAVVVKTKPRGRLETELPKTLEPFQVDDPNPARPVPETQPPATLINPHVDADVVLIPEHNNQRIEDEENEYPDGDTEEEEFIDNEGSSSEPEEEPILSDSN